MSKRLNVSFAGHGWEDYQWWQTNNKAGLKRVNKLINDTMRSPFRGIGEPEPLSGELSGYYSRRINKKDRIVYRVFADRIEIIQLRFHYSDH
ncbi:MAG TPA: Txe/YoeB family addiction module toxin [Candidatus Limosilactobacillus faecipullorum]|nr:Txe/YoeB family addiction module toxin [Candidatus Limosilactobacillus faecipullorum]